MIIFDLLVSAYCKRSRQQSGLGTCKGYDRCRKRKNCPGQTNFETTRAKARISCRDYRKKRSWKKSMKTLDLKRQLTYSNHQLDYVQHELKMASEAVFKAQLCALVKREETYKCC